MLALARIGVLEQRRAVEARQPMLVLRKMSRHPIENQPDSGLMTAIDEVLEVFRRSIAAGRREKPEHLVAPGSGKRMLHHRQQLDMRKARIANVRDQAIGQLSVSEKPIVLFGHPGPRSQV